MDAFISEIRIFPFTYNPVGWIPCDGRELNVGQYQALYSLIGNMYGGTAPQTFCVPNFNVNGTANMAVGTGTAVTGTVYQLAKPGGIAAVTLTESQMPNHTHTFNFSNNPIPAQSSNTPKANTYFSRPYASATNVLGTAFNVQPTGNIQASLNTSALGIYAGTGGPHNNLMPFVAMGFFINYDGEYPVSN
ncbi:hypothetical protein BEL04_14680 [Mucilaginibacter sp. PPCGB 2223]|uniref:phage tail protein n=1 Tax=Mucilaginibacter sp. PPCGB 2223 TaxID=1886027 RepID=UPI0008265DC8|nr:tail fiber protein [Mucilaginibacter sp. PPCGB 2223]OCX52689.1 hypothetical protein BEL04_14680 [Mucilaginibacter sp. PPCGB 2223]